MTNDKLQKWALIAEIGSGIAVLVTLIVLVIEVRSNTDAIKTDTYDRLVAEVIDWNTTIATDNEVGDAMRVFNFEGSDSANESQRYIIQRFIRSLWMIYERAFLQWEEGNMSDAQFVRFRTPICRGLPEAIGLNLDIALRRQTSPSFSEFRDDCYGE